MKQKMSKWRSHIRYLMHSAKVLIIRHAAWIIITKQTSAWEAFSIRQKLDIFGLHNYVNIDKVEILHVLGPRHLRHNKVPLLNLMGYIPLFIHTGVRTTKFLKTNTSRKKWWLLDLNPLDSNPRWFDP